MSTADQHPHRSIGEVLGLLQEEYPDVTISKIRFLESQGLIAPERTASGFRKFYDSDVQRLRWILCKQTDHFLPLKVIKKMLDEGADTSMMGETESQQTLWPVDGAPGAAASGAAAPTAAEQAPSDVAASVGDRIEVTSDTGAAEASPLDAADPDGDRVAQRGTDRGNGSRSGRGERQRSARTRHPSPAHPSIIGRTMLSADLDEGVTEDPVGPTGTPVEASSAAEPPTEPLGAPNGGNSGNGGADEGRTKGIMTPADIVAALQEDPRPARSRSRGDTGDDRTGGAVPSDPIRVRQFSVEDLTSTSGRGDFLSAEEVCEMFDIEQSLLDELEKFGLIAPRRYGGTTSFDGSDVEIIAVSVRYAAMGVEPRHLRMYKIAAEREAGFVEQLVLPILKQRNPAAKQNAAERSSQLASMGDELHNLILRRHLRNLLDNR